MAWNSFDSVLQRSVDVLLESTNIFLHPNASHPIDRGIQGFLQLVLNILLM